MYIRGAGFYPARRSHLFVGADDSVRPTRLHNALRCHCEPVRTLAWQSVFYFISPVSSACCRIFRRLFPFRQRRQHHRRRDHAPPQYCEPPCGVCVRCADRRIAEDTILHIRRQPGRYHQPAGDLDQQRCCPARQRPAEGHRPQQFCAIPVPPQDADWLRHLEMLGEAAEDARHRAAEQARLRQLLDEQETACRRAASDLDNIRTDLAALLHQGGARDDGDFLQTAALLEERHRTEQRRLLLEDSLRLVAGTQPLETFLASFREEAREEEEQACAGQQHLLEGLRQEEDALAEEVAALGVRVEAMRQDGTLADLLQQEADQREELQRQARAWCRLRLAHALLHRAKLAFEKERQPRVIRRAAAIFRDITAGAWQDVGAVVGDSSLRVMPPQGEPVSPEQLSRGTQEQLYLALRLAYIQDHAAQASPLPVIMDDVLVDFDPGRARRTARILGDLSQGRYGPRQQILFFTCHPHTAALLREVQPSAPLFLLDKGQLRPAGPEGAEEVPLRP